jgi:hypothetical protein
MCASRMHVRSTISSSRIRVPKVTCNFAVSPVISAVFRVISAPNACNQHGRRNRTRSERKDRRRSGTGPLRSTPPPPTAAVGGKSFGPGSPASRRREARGPERLRQGKRGISNSIISRWAVLSRGPHECSQEDLPRRRGKALRAAASGATERRGSAGVEPRRGARTSWYRRGGRLVWTSGAIRRRTSGAPPCRPTRSPKVERAPRSALAGTRPLGEPASACDGMPAGARPPINGQIGPA